MAKIRCSESRKRYAEVSKGQITSQFELKMANEKGNAIRKVEAKAFEAFPTALRESFSENKPFVETACSRLEQWTGRTLTGAITILEIMVEKEFPQERERFAGFAQKCLDAQKKERLRAEMLFDLRRR